MQNTGYDLMGEKNTSDKNQFYSPYNNYFTVVLFCLELVSPISYSHHKNLTDKLNLDQFSLTQ